MVERREVWAERYAKGNPDSAATALILSGAPVSPCSRIGQLSPVVLLERFD